MSLAEFIAQPLILAAGGFLLVGAAAVVYVMKMGGSIGGSGGSKKYADILRPTDHSGFPLKLTDETEKGLQGPKIGEVYWRLLKGGPGWNFPKEQRKFYAIEGDAYTTVFVDDQPKKCSLVEAMKILWGETAYLKMPPQLKDIIEHHQFAVTIEPEPIKKDKTLAITMEDHDRENIKVAMDELGKNMKTKNKFDWRTAIMGASVGILIGVMLVSFKVIRLA